MARTAASIAIYLLVAGMHLIMLDASAQSRPSQDVRSSASKSDSKKNIKIESMAFDVPAQPLQNALDTFGILTGFSGLYGTASTAGRISSPVSGNYTPDAALSLMLEGTGLTAYFTAIDAFVLEPAAASSYIPAERDNSYEGLLQAQVRNVFCQDPLIAPGNYRIALRFHLDARGRVLKPLLLDTTGDSKRDNAIISALRQVDVGRGPANSSKPFFMLILPQAHASVRDCTVH